MSTTLPILEEPVVLPKWGCALTILCTPDGPYCVLRQLCQIIGVEDTRGSNMSSYHNGWRHASM
jgi:hypothetical protein